MIANILSFGYICICFVLFAVSALATLQNVTVDDTHVPSNLVLAYIPSASGWEQPNNCAKCLVNPDPSFAYDGTWHYAMYLPNGTTDFSFEFSFEGSGLYIFFILANTGSNVTTLTNVSFALDGAQVSSFKHEPSTSTDFEYNQTVYANDSIPYGQHTMQVAPVNDSVNSVLILFDYFIYTTDDSNSASPSPTLSTSSTSFTSSASSTLSASSGPSIGAIVGGSVGGVAALAFVITSVIYYQRYKRRIPKSEPLPAVDMVEPFISFPTSSSHHGTTSPTGSPPTQTGLGHKSSTSPPPPVQPQMATSSTRVPSSPVVSSNAATEILEQVGMLRGEIARLHRHQGSGWNRPELRSEPPPEYSPPSTAPRPLP